MQDVRKIPFLNLSDEFKTLEPDWQQAISEVGKSGVFILGPNVNEFEKEAASYLGVKHTIGLANGTDALVLALRGLGIQHGDEVITSPFTFFASAEAIVMAGATPVFADIQADSFNIDPESIRKKLTSKTKAILPVHIFGNPANMHEINTIAKDHNLFVIEDAAQAFGAMSGDAKVGAAGDAGAFSFYPTKVLGCYGDGGLLSTNSDEVNERVRKLRNHGAVSPFMHDEVGMNSRLDEIQAALLRLKLKKIEDDIKARQNVARQYSERLGDVVKAVPTSPEHGRHVFNLFTIRTSNRDQVRQRLSDQGIPSSLCYPKAMHLQAVFSHLGGRQGDLPVVEQTCTETLSLPVYPAMPTGDIDYICDCLKRAI